ncbi:5674_t:CDS:2 [Scutellospora calospora]|uniref:5674_t:CDS:1 n=1 Tax=Scutellospora calospora TaxID=85575 RepID=A0ACA9K261_9GLOM|nr:5674_t:CDS:2 [Scutellospora calospora]
MPCYASTIVRVKYVKKHEYENTNFIRVWAIGGYPVECKDYEIKMILFAPANLNERDPESQAIFEKVNFYSVGGKIMTVSTSTHLTILNKVVTSNKCPLKISLVGVSQNMPQEVLNDENAIIQNTIRPYELLIFVVRQMEIFSNDFYVYTTDINFIDTCFDKKILDNSMSQIVSVSENSVCSKLLVTYRNISESAKEKEESFTSNSNDAYDKPELNSSDNLPFQKHVQIEDVKDEQSDHKSYADETNTLIDFEQKEGEPSNSYQENSSQSHKGKESSNQCLHSALRSHSLITDSTK